LYKGFYRKNTKVGFFVKGSARIVEPPRIEYKGFKVKFNKKGDICRGLIARSAYRIKRIDNSVFLYNKNDIILLKKKQEPKSKYLYGPIPYNVKRKKFLILFKKII
jgi:ribosomal protein L14